MESGDTIGPYRITEELGRGGTAIVYQGERTIALLNGHLYTDTVAIKVSRTVEFGTRIADEHRLALHLPSNDYVVGFRRECYHVPQGRAVVLNLVEGNNLGVLIEEYLGDRQFVAMPVLAALEAVRQAALGAHALHTCRLRAVHKDIKPDNLMIDVEGHVKLIDLSIADFCGRQHQLARGETEGTVNYMSPEQAQRLPVNHYSDQFSLGTTLYTLLTGTHAFSSGGIRKTVREILFSCYDERIARVEARHAGAAAVLRRCWNGAPMCRYPSALALTKDIEAILCTEASLHKAQMHLREWHLQRWTELIQRDAEQSVSTVSILAQPTQRMSPSAR